MLTVREKSFYAPKTDYLSEIDGTECVLVRDWKIEWRNTHY